MKIPKYEMERLTEAINSLQIFPAEIAPFEGKGIDLFLNFLLKKGLELAFQASRKQRHAGTFAGPSYDVTIWDKSQLVGKEESDNFYHAVTWVGCQALGLVRFVKPEELGPRQRPQEETEDDFLALAGEDLPLW